jgi:uncharacterized protein YbbC (DUF1343 family)
MQFFLILIIGLFACCFSTIKDVEVLSEECSETSSIKKSSDFWLENDTDSIFDNDIIPAAHITEKYIPLLKGKKIGLVVNQTSMINQTHLVDSLISLGCDIKKIFAPEHGFRGTNDRGVEVKDEKDAKTGIPIISLFGKNLKPDSALVSDLDILIFDIQDVGVRFYTYTSTMSNIMESAAKFNKPLLILDRPNPLGHCVDGPVMEDDCKSFVGKYPVPVIHGLTTAEYALMINGEGWLPDSMKCQLIIIECQNYNHKKFYKLPVKPSPNLPDMRSIYLYPSLCLFEGANVSLGRGTLHPFQMYGHPKFKKSEFYFIPQKGVGEKKPIYFDEKCFGFDLRNEELKVIQKNLKFDISYFVNFYNSFDSTEKSVFFTKDKFIDKLIGNKRFKDQIIRGETVEEISNSWIHELNNYKKLRKKYLLYKEE